MSATEIAPAQQCSFPTQSGPSTDDPNDTNPAVGCVCTSDKRAGRGGSDVLVHSGSDAACSESEADASRFSKAWEDDEHPPLDLDEGALRHVATYFLPGNHGRCVKIEKLGRGTFHEIRLLHFEDDWTCIGRFTRDPDEPVAVIESECATRSFVRKHTTIPVPETYFANYDPTNAVGAPFVLMEYIDGYRLQDMWRALDMRHKLPVMSQIADVVAQLARCKFDKIGSLSRNGDVGPLLNIALPYERLHHGPYECTQDYLLSFIDDDLAGTEELMSHFRSIRQKLIHHMNSRSTVAFLEQPFRLIHGDFDLQNFMFDWKSPDEAPKLLGVIDWDYSYIGPAYFLYEYPSFILDSDYEMGLWTEHKVCRKNFVSMLAQHFPPGLQEREEVRSCFRQKSYLLNRFRNIFMVCNWEAGVALELALEYSLALSPPETTERAYGGRDDYEPDSELEDECTEGDVKPL
ncbi:hypothetical protein LTR86_002314 [Recurvomyces mirabilis]|nr:hypothetical protein LTR86_002314 [Recurvomyces mirabilis]